MCRNHHVAFLCLPLAPPSGVMIQERRPLPESVGGLMSSALRAYRRRFWLYFGIAFGGLVLEAVAAAVAAYVRPGELGTLYAAPIAVDSLISAVVTIGIVADLRHDDRSTSATITGIALGRWGIVAVVTTLVTIVDTFTTSAIFGPPENTAYGFLALPIIVLSGSLSFASVIAALDDKTAARILVLSSIGRSLTLALARQNLGRLIALALIAILPTLVETVLSDQLAIRKVAGWQFVGAIPIDALITGPLQAIFTLFYLDFVRRTTNARNV